MVDPPATLPVEYLSLSSLKKFQMCPEKWRRHYLDHDPEPSSGKMVLGSAAGAALAQHYGTQIETGEGLCAEALLDEFSSEWEDRRTREDVDYEKEAPGEMKDAGARALALYHATVAPHVEPVSVERGFELCWPGVDWRLTGFIDLETADGRAADYKLSAKRIERQGRGRRPAGDDLPRRPPRRGLTGRGVRLPRDGPHEDADRRDRAGPAHRPAARPAHHQDLRAGPGNQMEDRDRELDGRLADDVVLRILPLRQLQLAARLMGGADTDPGPRIPTMLVALAWRVSRTHTTSRPRWRSQRRCSKPRSRQLQQRGESSDDD